MTDKEAQNAFYKHVGEQIQMRRIENLLTQDDLAYLFNTSRVQITMIENGKQKISLHLLAAIIDFFKMDLYYVIPRYDFEIKTLEQLKDKKIGEAKARLEMIGKIVKLLPYS